MVAAPDVVATAHVAAIVDPAHDTAADVMIILLLLQMMLV